MVEQSWWRWWLKEMTALCKLRMTHDQTRYKRTYHLVMNSPWKVMNEWMNLYTICAICIPTILHLIFTMKGHEWHSFFSQEWSMQIKLWIRGVCLEFVISETLRWCIWLWGHYGVQDIPIVANFIYSPHGTMDDDHLVKGLWHHICNVILSVQHRACSKKILEFALLHQVCCWVFLYGVDW